MVNKKYSPQGKSCKVTFALPAEVAADRVSVLGAFNEWDADKHVLTLKKKDGVWTRTIALKPGQAYAFRYLIDGQDWRNDDEADRFEYNVFGTENGVIEL